MEKMDKVKVNPKILIKPELMIRLMQDNQIILMCKMKKQELMMLIQLSKENHRILIWKMKKQEQVKQIQLMVKAKHKKKVKQIQIALQDQLLPQQQKLAPIQIIHKIKQMKMLVDKVE